MATSISVTWVKSVVSAGGVTKYRLQTTCSSPVGISDAALFVFSVSPDSYLQVAAVGDMLAYWPANPAVRQLDFAAATSVDSGDIGCVVTGGTSGDTGHLLGYSSDKKTWYVAPDTTDDTFDPAEVATITPSGHNATIVTVTGHTRYRATTATQDFNTPQLADERMTVQQERIQNLITDWENGYGSFPGTTTESIHAP